MLNLINQLRNLRRYSKYATTVNLNYLAHRGLVANLLVLELIKADKLDKFAEIITPYIQRNPTGDIPRAIKVMLGIADENELPKELVNAKDKADALETAFLVYPKGLDKVDPTFPEVDYNLDELDEVELNMSKYLTILRFNNGDVPVMKKPITLAEHVAETILLVLNDPNKFAQKILKTEAEINRLLVLLTVHDFMELYTADIPTPIKVKMEDKVRNLEYQMFVILERKARLWVNRSKIFKALREILNVKDDKQIIDEFGLDDLKDNKVDLVRLVAKYYDIYSLFIEALAINEQAIANEAYERMMKMKAMIENLANS